MHDLYRHLEHFSANSFNRFRICPEQWRRHYLLQEVAKPVGNLIFGKAFHTGVAHDLRARITDPEKGAPTGDVLDAASDEFMRELDHAGGADKVDWGADGQLASSESEFKLVATATRERMLKLVAVHHAVACPKIRPIAVEEKFELELVFSSVPIIGYIDAEEELGLKEHKTASRRPSRGSIRGDWLNQGRIYQLAKEKAVTWDVSVKSAQPTVVMDAFVEPYSERMAQMTERSLATTISRIKWYYDTFGPDAAWPSDATHHTLSPCSWCGWGPNGTDECFWHTGIVSERRKK